MHQTYYDGTQFLYAGIIPTGSIVTSQVVAKGKAIKIDSQNTTFHEAIVSLSFKHSCNWISQQLQENTRVYFGPIEMDQDHLYFKNKTIDQKEIKEVKVEQGKLVLHLNSKWFATKIPIRDIPNFSSLHHLLAKK